MSFDDQHPDNYLGKIGLSWVDIWMGYFARPEVGSVSLHLHYFPDNPGTRKKMAKIIQPISMFGRMERSSFIQTYFRAHSRDGLGCAMGLILDEKVAKEIVAAKQYTADQKRLLKQFLIEIFKEAE